MIPKGFQMVLVDSLDVPVCNGPAHENPIHCTTQSLTGEWYCRDCEPERANKARELTLRTVAAAMEIRRRFAGCKKPQTNEA